MTLTLELTPAEEAHLAAAAAQNGLEPAALVEKSVEDNLPAWHSPDADPLSEAEKREKARVDRIRALTGSMAHVPVSVEDLHRERQADKAKEEAWIKGYMP